MSTNRVASQVSRESNGRWYTVRRPSPSAMGGALFGGVMGAALGPTGAIVGMVIGGLAGEAVERRHDAPHGIRGPEPS